MRVLVTGGTGFIGGALVRALSVRGDAVTALTRNVEAPASRALAALPGVRLATWSDDWRPLVADSDAVVNLAGEPVVGRRWSPEQKARIRASRIETTRSLVEAMRSAPRPPAAFLSASAVGFYGAHADEPLDESAPAGSDFLSQVCVEWEHEAQRAPEGVRTVVLRIGIVLGEQGGSLAEMVRPFRLGAGGPIGSGRQWVSWVHRDDVVRLALHALDTPDLSGILNATAPEPVRQAELARAIGRALGRPSWLPVPRIALRLALGEVASMLVEGQRVVPARALASGFRFEHGDLARSLEALLRA
jgi:uncharacterized protein (TIGR01777 family)